MKLNQNYRDSLTFLGLLMASGGLTSNIFSLGNVIIDVFWILGFLILSGFTLFAWIRALFGLED